MDRNFLLALALSFLVLTLWTFYTAPPPKPAGEAPAVAGETAPPQAVPEAPLGGPPPPLQPAPAAPAQMQPVADERLVPLESDLVRAAFTTRGGALLHWELTAYDDAYLPGRPRVELTTFDPETQTQQELDALIGP